MKKHKLLSVVVLLLACGTSYAAKLIDPTRPPNVINTAQSQKSISDTLNLSSILVSAQHKAATINGKHLEIGGSIDGLNIVEIDKNKVILMDKNTGKQYTLSLFQTLHQGYMA